MREVAELIGKRRGGSERGAEERRAGEGGRNIQASKRMKSPRPLTAFRRGKLGRREGNGRARVAGRSLGAVRPSWDIRVPPGVPRAWDDPARPSVGEPGTAGMGAPATPEGRMAAATRPSVPEPHADQLPRADPARAIPAPATWKGGSATGMRPPMGARPASASPAARWGATDALHATR